MHPSRGMWDALRNPTWDALTSPNEKIYPRMAALARYYLSIPASSAFSERCFSFAGNTRSIKRTAIDDSKLEMMAILKTIDCTLWSLVENDNYSGNE